MNQHPKKLTYGVDYTVDTSTALGHGAYGQVYCGRIKKSGEPIAVKRVPKNKDCAEYEILSRLHGLPNIVQVLGVDESVGDIVMERAQLSLDALMRMVPFTHGLPPRCMQIFCSHIGKALRLLRDENIAHRDIKPHNILVFGIGMNGTASNWTFKLCDFGAARRFSVRESDMYSIVGTVPFLQPQLVKEYLEHPKKRQMNSPYQSEKCDMWSVAVTLHFAATATLPFWTEHRKLEEMFSQRPTGSICSRERIDGGFEYYSSLPNDTYPPWLLHALNCLISRQFDDPSYDHFFSCCEWLGHVQPKRIIRLPHFIATEHVDCLSNLFQKTLSLKEVFNIPPQSESFILNGSRILYYGPVQRMIRSAELQGETHIMWNEKADSAKVFQMDCATPVREAENEEGEYWQNLQKAFHVMTEEDQMLSDWQQLLDIIHKHLVMALKECVEMEEKVKAAEEKEDVASTFSSLTSALNRNGLSIFQALQPAKRELTARNHQIQKTHQGLARIIADLMKTEKLDETGSPASHKDAIWRLTKQPRTDENRAWVRTLLERSEQRLRLLHREILRRLTLNGRQTNNNLSGRIQEFLAISVDFDKCKQLLKETAALIQANLFASQSAVKAFVEEATGEEEKTLRQDLRVAAQFNQTMVKAVRRWEEFAGELEAGTQRLISSLSAPASL